MRNPLCLALLLIPLAGPINIAPFLSVTNSKEFLVLLTVMVMLAVPGKTDRRFINWPLKFLLAFLVLSCFSIPPIIMHYGTENMGGLWVWRAMFWALAYYLLYRSIQRIEINPMSVARAIGWAAFISSIYAYVQFLGIDQWQGTRPYAEIGQKSSAGITAMIGNPTYLAVWLGMCLPFCLYSMRWWQTVMVGGAIFIYGSEPATAGAILAIVLMAAMRTRSTVWLKTLVCGAVISAGLVCGLWSQIRPHVGDSGRFSIWQEVIQDWRGPCINLPITPDMSDAKKREITLLNQRTYPLTGRGVGSFEFIFGPKHIQYWPDKQANVWNDPHNIYLRALYEIGIIGTILLLGTIGIVFWLAFPLARTDPWTRTLFCALFYCCLVGMTTPLFVVEPLRLYCVAIFSLLTASRMKNNLTNPPIWL